MTEYCANLIDLLIDYCGMARLVRALSSSVRAAAQVHAASVGRVELICGPMFAGKSTELLRRLRRHDLAGKKCLVVKHALDDRYDDGANDIVTHDQARESAVAVGTLVGMNLDGFDVVGVDEAQFFDADDIAQFCGDAAARGVDVVVAGLDGDYRQRPFAAISQLLPVVDTVSRLSAVCAICGSDAHFSCRTVASDDGILVGGAEAYRASCRGCLA